MKMYLVYDEEDNAPIIAPSLGKVAKYLDLTLASIRSYISNQHPIRHGFKVYELDETKKESKQLRRIL